MISVEQALSALFDLVHPMPSETVPLVQATGRSFTGSLSARRNQPPFSASAMDGYAVVEDDPPLGTRWTIVGESAAGDRFDGSVKAGQAVRIFTGAPVPDGANRVIIQEDVERNSSEIALIQPVSENRNIRPIGGDFKIGDTLSGPRILSPSDIALLAAMNIAQVPVSRRPSVALIATGDELVSPGQDPGRDQIIASNSYGLYGLLRELGALPRLLPVARDNLSSLEMVFGLAQDTDLIVTIGGASVGDHDLVAEAASNAGMEQSFYKVAMRPGKPLMAGRMGQTSMVGLPGNPVSAMVCGHIFLAPMVRAMLGQPATPAPREVARLAKPLAANGPREHYMRAYMDKTGVSAFDKQDSSLLTVLSDANCLIVQPPHDLGRAIGDEIEVIAL